MTVISHPTSERNSRIAADSTDMGDEQNQNEVHTPADEEEDMAGAETDEETNHAVAQARLIAGID